MNRSAFFASLERYFEGTLDAHGATAQGVDWNSPESQELRFEQLLRLVPGAAPFSMVDYGCGYGALAGWLRSRGYEADYRGFDVSERMIQEARALHPSRFVTREEQLDEADYAVASGVFNLRLDVADGPWRDYVLDTLRSLDRLGRRGFAFNMLTSYSDPERMRDDLYYGDPCLFFDHCKRTYSRNVALLHDYGLYEFTLLVRK